MIRRPKGGNPFLSGDLSCVCPCRDHRRFVNLRLAICAQAQVLDMNAEGRMKNEKTERAERRGVLCPHEP